MSQRKKSRGDLVWFEDQEAYFVCSWCPKKYEVEEHVRLLEMALQFISHIRGVKRASKMVKHAICEKHKRQVLREHEKKGAKK